MFKRVALAASVAALTVATPAFAQDGGGFTGFNVNAIVGWDHVDLGGGFKDDGVAFGVGVGYDFNTGGAVIGIEAEAADSTVKQAGISAKRDLYAGVRVGGEVSPGTLLYAKVGYSNAQIDFCDPGSCTSEGDGVRGGVGLEHQFNGNAFVKVEYRYTNYEAGVERHQVVTGVGFRF
jgi:outer membrane immunogenic protein